MRTLVGVLIALILPHARAGENGRAWLAADYTFSDVKFVEPGSLTETGRFAGVRGELGFFLFSGLGLSVGGSYMDGNLNYDGTVLGGTSLTTITKDYFRTLEALAVLNYGPMRISAGPAERYWYDDLVVSYRRRTRYNYIPVYVMYRVDGFYFKFEHDIWQRGWNKSHMSDVNPAAHDVEFTLGAGTGVGGEIGFFIPGYLTTRIFVAYHKWSIKQSDVQSDGTQNLSEPENTTTEIKGGLGIEF